MNSAIKLALILSALIPSIDTSAATNHVVEQGGYSAWNKLQSVDGNCCVCFPCTPEHVRHKAPHPNSDADLLYSVYVAGQDTEVVYMLLVAECTGQMTGNDAEKGLESLLNSLLTQNANNKLVYADLVHIDGEKGLDFCIQTGSKHFRGRAILGSNNVMYLLACECCQTMYNHESYTYFIESFELQD